MADSPGRCAEALLREIVFLPEIETIIQTSSISEQARAIAQAVPRAKAHTDLPENVSAIETESSELQTGGMIGEEMT